MSEREWPERPERAGTNPVDWSNMTVTFRGDTPPPQAEDRDRWDTPDGTYVRRGGEWMTLENKPGEQYGFPQDVTLENKPGEDVDL